MSKVIAGLSEEDAITFTTRMSRITLHFNGRLEYKEIIKKDDSKLPCPLSLVYIMIFILEFLMELPIRHFGKSIDAVIFLTFVVFVILFQTINAFSTRESTKRNHAAEHMVYNANRKGIDLTLDNVRKSKVFCEYCGSCQVGNLVFMAMLNIPLVLITGFWIPYTFLSWLTRNLPKAIPFNPFTHLVQEFVTEKPNDFNLFISLLAMNMVKSIDAYKERNGEIDSQATIWILDEEIGKLLRDNDFSFDTSNLKTIFNPKNGGLWPPFFLCVNIVISNFCAILLILREEGDLKWM